ncbi:hypothetical protein D7Z94_08795 [Ulvibacterium marinum]|uniref:Uncharacterized protein n=1 Tax=Ulvibacterium marinum TaxID=2419782 RepID=A0A3B0C950_9FLAO|nr:hypothetical protein D7Z94_08795 [Ulvibacterium marinum]
MERIFNNLSDSLLISDSQNQKMGKVTVSLYLDDVLVLLRFLQDENGKLTDESSVNFNGICMELHTSIIKKLNGIKV